MDLNLRNYVLLFVVVLTTVYFGNQLRQANDTLDKKENDRLIQQYLLNETKAPEIVTKMVESTTATEVAKSTRPKLWIHITYDRNARKWASFGSRSSTNLNQPYLHLTVKSIIQHCGNDFHICLIDDDSFADLLPDWNIRFDTLSEPFSSRARQYGLARLLYKYGGLVLPPSFICFRNMMPFYKEALAMCGTGEKGFFVTEHVNHHANITHNNKRLLFVPDSFIMGSTQGDAILGKWIEFMEHNGGPHFQNQTEFLGDSNRWFLSYLTAADRRSFHMVDGSLVGVKTAHNEAILLDNLMESAPLDLNPNCFGVYIPADELLTRTKYEWYSVLSTEELMKSKPIITKYLIQSLYTSFMDDMDVVNMAKPGVGVDKPKFVIPSQIGGGGI